MNPHFPATRALVLREKSRMARHPIPLLRPLIVLGGWRSPPWQALSMARRLLRLTSANASDSASLSYTTCSSIERAAMLACRAVENHWPSPDPGRSIEVDVVGISMGGLVGRAAAAGLFGNAAATCKRLHIRRLFTVASPHRGARLARLIAPDRAVRCMIPGCSYLADLDRAHADADYELIPYARTRDAWVGATNTAPPGADPFWAPGPWFLSHLLVSWDDRIAVDIALRLRGETPIAMQPSPPPRD